MPVASRGIVVFGDVVDSRRGAARSTGFLRALRETRGGAVAVSEMEIQDAQRLVARTEGIWTAPESAALVAALARLKDGGVVARDAEVMLILTGAGLKYAPPPLAPPTDLAGSEEEVLAQVRRAVGA